MKILILAIALAISSSQLFAEKYSDSSIVRPYNSVSINMFGDGSILSAGFERLFEQKTNFFLSGKIGIGFTQEFRICVWGPCDKPKNFLTLPHQITANFGKGRHFLEMGAGGTFIVGDIAQHYQVYPILGYRYQPLKPNKFNFRIFGSLPLIKMKSENILFIPVGFSLGYCF
jgi:hypothetical protein